MKPWSEVAASRGFQALPAADQDAARRQYFDDVVAPKVPEADRDTAWGQFDADTRIAKADLPRGMAPSTAGGGRGSVNPPAVQSDDDLSRPAGALRRSIERAPAPAARAPLDERRSQYAGRVRDADIPDATVGSVLRDAAASTLQIGPTAVKGLADVARLATGDRVGKGLSDRAEDGMRAIREVVGSERGNLQRKKFEQDMADPNVSAAEAVADNKGALVDQAVAQVGSMLLPAGAAGAATKAATAGRAAQVARAIDEATVINRARAAGAAGATGATVVQNAADTYGTIRDKGGDQDQAYLGAAITAPVTYAAGRLTGGAAEAQAARLLSRDAVAEAADRGLAAVPRAMLREGAQEVAEEAGQFTGETVGTGSEFDRDQLAKRLAVAGTLGAAMGGGVNTAGQVATRADEPARPAQAAEEAPVEPAAAEDAQRALQAVTTPPARDVAQAAPEQEGGQAIPAPGPVQAAAADDTAAVAQRIRDLEAAQDGSVTVAPPADADAARIQRLRDAGEDAAADLMQTAYDQRQAAAAVDTELAGMQEVAPDAPFHGSQTFQQLYRQLRVDGTKPAEAAARAGIVATVRIAAPRFGFPAAAMDRGLSVAASMPIAEVPAFLQRYAQALAKRGLVPEGPALANVDKLLAQARDQAMAAAVESVYREQQPAAAPAPDLRAARPEQLLAAAQNPTSPLADAAAAELRRRETDATYQQMEEQRGLEEDAIVDEARDQQAAQATAASVAQESDAPTALAAAMQRAARKNGADLAGERIDGNWSAFAPETGTLAVPRNLMPQVQAVHRGALVNFLAARGITHEAGTVPADDLRPTQAEFSPRKVAQAGKFKGTDRSILISSDGYVVDGHHQWLAKRAEGEPVKVIRLDAPIAELLPVVAEFPSARTARGAQQGESNDPATPAVRVDDEQPGGATPAAPAGAGEPAGRPADAQPDAGGPGRPGDPAEPVADVQPAVPAAGRARKPAAAVAPPAGREVSREIGKYREGLSEFRANQVRNELARKNPEVDYAVEEDTALKNGFAVVGRERVGPSEPAFRRDGTDLRTAARRASDARLVVARELVDGLAEGWTNAPEIIVARNMQDEVIPQKVRDYDAKLKSQGAEGEPRAFILSGKVYLLSDQLNGPVDVATALFHEVLGHHGLRRAFGTDLDQVLKQIATIRKSDVAAKAREYGLDLAKERDRMIAAEEVLAEMAQDRPHLTFVQKAVAAIRNWLRAHVPGFKSMKLSDADIIEAFILPARGAVTRRDETMEQALQRAMPAFSRTEDASVPIPDAIIGSALGSATSHPDYAAAKAGDVHAAVRLAQALVTPDLVQKVKSAIGNARPRVLPVAAEEASGRNKIPRAAAEVLAKRAGLQTATGIVQANRARRTGLDGLDRIFAPVEFEGNVEPGDYLLLDDTLTQGGTFAALASHIREGGGRVVGVIALTGKQYSARIQPSPETLASLRQKHGDLEDDFRAATGYGFDALTQSEARYLASYEPAQRLRDRIADEGRRGRERADQGDSGRPEVDGGPRFSRSAGADLTSSAGWQVPETNRVDRAIYEAQDSRVDLKRVQEAIAASGREIEERFDARTAETLYAGRVAHRNDQFLRTEVKPLLSAMALSKTSMDDLADFLHARGAQERNEQIARVNPDMPDGGAGTNTKGVLMTNAAAAEYLAALPAERRAVLDRLAKHVDAITAGTRRLLVAEGLEKAETIAAWEGAYKHYVPMFRDEAEAGAPHPTGGGFSVRGGNTKRATGSKKEVTNILAHVLMQREAALTRAEKNRVGMALYGLALSNPNRDFWTTIRPGMAVSKIAKELEAMGVDPVVAEAGMAGVPTVRTVDPVLDRVVDRPNPMYKSLPGAVVLKVDGEDRVLMLNVEDPRALRMAESLKNLDGLTRFDLAGSIVGQTTRWLAAVNTQYNPAFGLVNGIRDTFGGAINLTSTPLRGQSARVLWDAYSKAGPGIAAALSGKTDGEWAKLYEQFKEDGGQTGYRELFRTAADRTAAIEKELAALSSAGKPTPGKVAHAMLDLLDGFNTTIENAVRLSAYKAGLDQGLSRPQAAKLARELTVDFNRKGRAGRELGPLYAFFNASVQGSARTVEALKGPAGAKIIAGGLALGAAQAILLAMAGYDDDEIPEFIRTRALILPLSWRTDKQAGPDGAKPEKRFVAIPMPLGLHVLPNTGRVMAELALNGGKDAGKRVFDAVGEVAGAFNPLGGGNIFTADGALRTALPTVVDPIVELGFNRNFAGNQIERDTRGETDVRPGFARAKESTQRSATGHAYLGISKAINALTGGTAYEAGMASPTPERVQYIAQVAGGGLLREIEKIINLSAAAAQGDKVAASKVPVAGRLYGTVDDDAVQRSRYFEAGKKLDKAQAALKAAQKAGDVDAMRKIMDANPMLVMSGAQDKVAREIAKLNKLAVTTINDRETLKQVDEARLAQMRALNDALRDLERTTSKPTLAQRFRGEQAGERVAERVSP